jgi:hypothetical protein
MEEIGINDARSMRAILFSAVNYFLSNQSALGKAGERLEWEDFENLPEWYLWSDESLRQLVLVAGTVFLLPTIRLWIEATKINTIQRLIGKSVFDFIMQYTNIENSPEQQIEMDNLQDVINASGASVILSSQDPRLHPWLVTKLPQAKGQLNRKVATELLNHTLYVLVNTNNKSTKEQDEEANDNNISDKDEGRESS